MIWYRRAILVFSGCFVLIGLALLVVTAVNGGAQIHFMSLFHLVSMRVAEALFLFGFDSAFFCLKRLGKLLAGFNNICSVKQGINHRNGICATL